MTMRLWSVFCASAMNVSPSWSSKYCGPVVASVASDSSRQARVRDRLAVERGRPPGRADPALAEDRLVDHAEHRQAVDQQRDQRAEDRPPGEEARGAVDRVEHPAAGPSGLRSTPNSSPCTPSRGTSAVRMRRIASSAARSAIVTGVASPLRSASTRRAEMRPDRLARGVGEAVGEGDVGGEVHSRGMPSIRSGCPATWTRNTIARAPSGRRAAHGSRAAGSRSCRRP